MNRLAGASLTLGLLSLLAVQLGSAGEADRSGQIVFVPWDSTDLRTNVRLGTEISIRSCLMVEGGLRVVGAVEGPNSQTPVLVAPGDPGDPGIAVSTTDFARTREGREGSAGEFALLLPWATSDSLFAVAEPATLDPRSNAVLHGPVATCPQN